MKVKNIVRKAVALGSGAALVGTTLMGAVAYDLSTYPAKYIVDGKFDGTIVVGEKAATADVLGSIDIAASLQGASVSKVPVSGSSSKVTLEGDAFELSTGADQVELREDIGDVVDSISDDDLAGLKSGKITTSEGTTDYSQFIRLQDGSTLQDIAVNYIKNDGEDEEVMSDYLVVDTGLPFLLWEIQFSDGLESELEGTSLEDLEDRSFNIMGTDFNIVSAEITGQGTNFELQLMGGSVPDTLREGETKTYTINGVDYEVTLVFVSDPSSSGSPEAKFSVNGELTDAMGEGDTETLSGGLQLGVRDILVNAREGVASFFLGADKIIITDADTHQSDDFDGDIEINEETTESDVVTVVGAFTTTANTTFEITSIKYRVTMESEDGSGGVAYIPAGHGARELMDEPELLLSESLDLRYEGLTEPQRTDVKIAPSGDDEYKLTFTNIDGDAYKSIPLLSNDAGTWKFGDNDDDLIFVEGTTTTFNIGSDDFFIVSDDRTATDLDKSVTNVLRYTDYEASDRRLEFEDLAGGKITVTVDTNGQGEIAVGSETYDVNVSSITALEPNITVDLNGDGDTAQDVVKITTWGGLVIDLAAVVEINSTLNVSSASGLADWVNNTADLESGVADDLSAQRVLMTGTVLSKNFDTSATNEVFNWTISEAANNEVDLSFGADSYIGPMEGSNEHDRFTFEDKEDDSETELGMTDYGVLITEQNPDDSSDPNTLTLSVPETQVFGQVFVTLGSVSATSTGGDGSADRVNPIAVGLAVLDSNAPAIGTENLIVVGGPCANSVASQLLGSPANCGEGFEPGKAMIQSFEQNGKVSILVAGYEATETLGASRVLASYKDYKDKLKGTEVEVVVADLNSIQVRSAQ